MAIIDYAFKNNEIDSNQIYVHGRSLGGAISIYAVRHTLHNIKGLIVENSFTSIPDMAKAIVFNIYFLKYLLITNWWCSIDIIG